MKTVVDGGQVEVKGVQGESDAASLGDIVFRFCLNFDK